MQQIFDFFFKNKTFLLFLLLFTIALSLTIQSHSYHKSKFINSANFLTGGIYESINSVDEYFNLKKENQKLLQENNRLKSVLFNSDIDKEQQSLYKFNVVSGKVIKAEVPLSEMFGYATALRSATQGRATYSMEFEKYAEAPKAVADAVISSKTGM